MTFQHSVIVINYIISINICPLRITFLEGNSIYTQWFTVLNRNLTVISIDSIILINPESINRLAYFKFTTIGNNFIQSWR